MSVFKSANVYSGVLLLFIPNLTAQQSPHFGFGQHVPEFDILGYFIRNQIIATPSDQVIAGYPLYIILSTT